MNFSPARGRILDMEPLVIGEGMIIPGSHLSVSFTRSLDGEDAVAAARKTPSMVELRFDTRGCPGLGPIELRKILAFAPLKADSRGTVRVSCSDHRSRAQNLAGARDRLRVLIREALAAPDRPRESPLEPPRRRRRGPGLIKGSDGAD